MCHVGVAATTQGERKWYRNDGRVDGDVVLTWNGAASFDIKEGEVKVVLEEQAGSRKWLALGTRVLISERIVAFWKEKRRGDDGKRRGDGAIGKGYI